MNLSISKLSCLIALLLFTVGATSEINGQDSKFGIRGGVNISNLYVEEVDDENAKIGFHAGIFTRSGINSIVAIQPEVLFSLEGSQINYSNLLFSGKIRYNLGYIKVPVLLMLNLGQHFNFHAGPYGGFLAYVKVKDVDTEGDTRSVTELDRDDFNTFDYGLVGGVGLNFEGGSISIRYNYGLNAVGKKDGAGFFINEGKNSVLQVSLGLGM